MLTERVAMHPIERNYLGGGEAEERQKEDRADHDDLCVTLLILRCILYSQTADKCIVVR